VEAIAAVFAAVDSLQDVFCSMLEGNLEEGELEIGQVSGLIRDILPAADIIENLWSEFRKSWAEPLPCTLQKT
jgi:NAD(P)H-dependent flavin oxidoreductase YrpB (nitropropane dioxygenase family)